MSTTHYAPIGQTPDPKGGSPIRSSSPSASTAQMTPDSNSDSDSDMDAGRGVESFEMKSFAEGAGKRQGAGPMSHHGEGYSRDMGDDDESEDEEHETRARDRRPSDSTVQSFQLYTPDEEQAVVRKFDRRLVPFLAFLYMLSFLDRSTSSQALVTSFPSLLVLRALLGIGEAAFGPGVPFYLSFFFKREELATRTGFFISAAPLATSFASSLAWAIMKLSERSPIAPWRMLFIVEGFPSVVAAIFAWQFIPDRPGSARFLSRRQKRVARLRLRNDKSGKGGEGTGRKLKWKEVSQALTDPICYLTAL
ncbi:hypothetical protein GP486_002976 [Trichoglossum hirsutum]|uniref:Major facilitator superfamily (MFS) profile domain-containing protein n=1 Tax=Trichoglossum hirsutum TaxID=265104 RepID=A0A9P8RRL0_9PEZI|nr:hypothetical protein GP486_002976 [Trichoglossum hirsutum]